jgi:hypothetical protein
VTPVTDFTKNGLVGPDGEKLTPFRAGWRIGVSEARVMLQAKSGPPGGPAFWLRADVTVPADRAKRLEWLGGYMAGLKHVHGNALAGRWPGD